MARENSIKSMIDAGLDLTYEEAATELREVIAEFSSNYEHHFDKLLLRIPEHKYNKVNPALIVAAGIVAYHDTKYKCLKPFEDVMEVLSILQKKNLLMGIISSGLAIKQFEKVFRLGVHKFIKPSAIFISEHIGFSKTNFKLYLKVCASLRLDPSEVMYVGDNPISDVDPPNQIGMITVLNRREGKYRDVVGRTEPKHIISNFWDLHEILTNEYEIVPSS